MRAVNALILLIVISSVSVAQTRPAPPAATPQPSTAQTQVTPKMLDPDPGWPTKVYSIRYVDYRYIYNLLAPIGVSVSGEPNLNAISVRGPEKTLAAVDDIIKRFDVPGNAPKNVDLTIYVVLGSPRWRRQYAGRPSQCGRSIAQRDDIQNISRARYDPRSRHRRIEHSNVGCDVQAGGNRSITSNVRLPPDRASCW